MNNTTNNTITQTQTSSYKLVDNGDGTRRFEDIPAGEYTYTENDYANMHNMVDTYPYEIVEIKTEKTIVIRSMNYDKLTETFSSVETRELKTIKKAKDGCWYSKGGMKKGTCYTLATEPKFYQSREF
jgi:hypothetical protein